MPLGIIGIELALNLYNSFSNGTINYKFDTRQY